MADPVPATLPVFWSGSFAPEESVLRRWIKQARTGDAAAFECILRHHEHLVLRTAQRLLSNIDDAKDAAQEVFLRLHRNLGNFREEQALIPWLYRVTVNTCLDVRRRENRRAVGSAETSEIIDSRLNPEESFALEQRQALLLSALDELSPKERAAIVLRDLEGCSTAEVASILGSSEATVRSQISSGRVKMRKFVTARSRTST